MEDRDILEPPPDSELEALTDDYEAFIATKFWKRLEQHYAIQAQLAHDQCADLSISRDQHQQLLGRKNAMLDAVHAPGVIYQSLYTMLMRKKAEHEERERTLLSSDGQQDLAVGPYDPDYDDD